MLQIIGLMVGAYILFRMVDALCSVDRNGFVKACAIVVIAFTGLCMFGMVVSGVKSPSVPSGLIR